MSFAIEKRTLKHTHQHYCTYIMKCMVHLCSYITHTFKVITQNITHLILKRFTRNRYSHGVMKQTSKSMEFPGQSLPLGFVHILTLSVRPRPHVTEQLCHECHIDQPTSTKNMDHCKAMLWMDCILKYSP